MRSRDYNTHNFMGMEEQMNASDVPHQFKEPLKVFLENYGCKPKDVSDIKPIRGSFWNGFKINFRNDVKYASIQGKFDIKK